MLIATILVGCGTKEVESEPSTDIIETFDVDGDGVFDAEDCDDNDATRYPGADEICDGIDNDCDDEIDNDATYFLVFYSDSDEDGFGDADVSIEACEAPEGYVDNMDDCNDEEMSSNPAADEMCDGMDNNCDGVIDEDLEIISSYSDSDEDGFGDADISIEDCTVPEGYVENMYDCDDLDADIGSSMDDMDCDGISNDEDDDVDGDGILADDECDDSDASMVQLNDSVSSISTDTDGDGVADTMETYTYNEFGQQATYSEVYDIDGDELSDEILQVFTYDADGNLTMGDVTYDYGMDGSAEISYTFVITYNTNGDILTAMGNGTRIDGSTFSYSRTWSYDLDGNQTSFLYEADWSGSGTTEQSSLQSYTYDPDGNMLSESIDQLNADGASLIDGVPEDTRTHTYDADGNRLTMEAVFDSDSDGMVDETYALNYSYNPDGRLDQYTLEYDWDADGTTDVLYTYNYTYNSDDLLERIEMMLEYVLEIYVQYNYTSVTTYLYTENGDLLVTEIDTDNDGEIDTIYTNTYNEDGQIIEEQDSDGTYTYAYISCPE
jgi:hypothetical protein